MAERVLSSPLNYIFLRCLRSYDAPFLRRRPHNSGCINCAYYKTHLTGVHKSGERKTRGKKKKEQEAVPVQSRAQLIQPVGVCGVSQFGQSIHSLHNDFQHVTDFPQHPTGFDSTKHWKAQTVKGS